jgi:hypothetical protein
VTVTECTTNPNLGWCLKLSMVTVPPHGRSRFRLSSSVVGSMPDSLVVRGSGSHRCLLVPPAGQGDITATVSESTPQQCGAQDAHSG